jgi:hypothetical protein
LVLAFAFAFAGPKASANEGGEAVLPPDAARRDAAAKFFSQKWLQPHT